MFFVFLLVTGQLSHCQICPENILFTFRLPFQNCRQSELTIEQMTLFYLHSSHYSSKWLVGTRSWWYQCDKTVRFTVIAHSLGSDWVVLIVNGMERNVFFSSECTWNEVVRFRSSCEWNGMWMSHFGGMNKTERKRGGGRILSIDSCINLCTILWIGTYTIYSENGMKCFCLAWMKQNVNKPFGDWMRYRTVQFSAWIENECRHLWTPRSFDSDLSSLTLVTQARLTKPFNLISYLIMELCIP